MYAPLCSIRLKKGHDDAIRKGMPWIYAGDYIDSSELLPIPAGSLVAIENHKGEWLGTGYFNHRSQITCRVLTLAREAINADFFTIRLKKALEMREKRIGVPYYRLAHSESDQLPGLLVDRFGDRLVVQAGTAGMELLEPLWLKALDALLKPKTVILRNDISSRTLEGLGQRVAIIKGELPDIVEVQENGCSYLADLKRGQKTGWYYDQRDNRRLMAEMSTGKSVLDMYAHSGGFGLLAAKHNAAHVTMADSSNLALELAKKAAEKNGVQERCSYLQGDAFEMMTKLAQEKKQYDIVLADPPAFVKSKKDINAGMKGYEKVARLAAPLVAPGGYLFMASCSHHAGRSAFNKAVLDGCDKSGRAGNILKQTGASLDHPRHKHLPQSEYLKGILLKL